MDVRARAMTKRFPGVKTDKKGGLTGCWMYAIILCTEIVKFDFCSVSFVNDHHGFFDGEEKVL